ncbi:hypothetical protein TI39_contig464g00003 [Zymoseptoria brevis]|uniref:Uncharacterized protein n=1 Tax=Zymoseptoria brevis TaxID=1047168 RepID=A0A0F4GKH2_9PEZI|nr:hypothetical protein TI39_contig464g00003 [Zymoseptoria brevis]
MNQEHGNHQVHASEQQNAAQQTLVNHTTKEKMAQLLETLEVLEGFCKEQKEKEWPRRLGALCSVTKALLQREKGVAKLKEENPRLEHDNQRLADDNQRLQNENQRLWKLVEVIRNDEIDINFPTLFEEFAYGEALHELEELEEAQLK